MIRLQPEIFAARIGIRRLVAVSVPRRGLHGTGVLLAGHSKWANIRHDKAKNDAKKLREAYSLATRIAASVKGAGVDGNAQLVMLVEKARKLNVAKKIIENAIKRGTGELTNDGAQTFEVTYEFMGPGGVAFIIDANTDNKTRTIGLVKHAMSKFNASLSPCQYLFERKGEVVFEPLSEAETLDDVLETAIDIGAEDVEDFKDPENEYSGERLFRIITAPGDLQTVSNTLSEKGYKLKDSKAVLIAETDNEVDFPDSQKAAFVKAMALLDEIPEITTYYSNIRE